MASLPTSQPKRDDNLSDVLPRDIMLDILSRLPAKTLIQFKSVSKPWYNLHTDPIFIQMQLNQTKKHTTNEQLVFIESQNYTIHTVSVESIEDESDHLVQLDHPRVKFCYRIWGSCDGLLCVQCVKATRDEPSPPLHVWNPLTRESKKLPCFEGGRYSFSAGGFVYNPHLSDYQVVGVFCAAGHSGYVFAICSLLNGSWRRISPKLDQSQKFWTKYGVTINGFLHWVTRIHIGKEPCDEYIPEFDNALVRFDNKTETFAYVPLPDCLLGSIPGVPTIVITEYQEKLALWYMRRGSICLWVMNEYGVKDSWEQKFAINMLIDGGTFWNLKLCLTKNALVVMGQRGKKLILYNPVTHMQREIKGVAGVKQVRSNFNFMETIVGHNVFQRKYRDLGRRKSTK